MTAYAGGFYRVGSNIDDHSVMECLEALQGLGLDFFPLALPQAKGKQAKILSPTEYRRDLVPAEFYISPGVARIPFECSNGVELSFTESDNPALYPASLVLTLTDETLRQNGWTLESLVGIFRVLVGVFKPDFAYLYDEAHASRREYLQLAFSIDRNRVPTAIYWINYFGREWSEVMGNDRIERLKSHVSHFERMSNGGVLFAIQADPYDEHRPEHRNRQADIESLIGLREVQARYPNPGL